MEKTVKTLALSRELLENFREDLRTQSKHGEAGEVALIIDEIDKLTTDIRTCLLPP